MKKQFNKKKLLTIGILSLFSLVLVSAIAYYAFFSATFNVTNPIQVTGDLDKTLDVNAPEIVLGDLITVSNSGTESREINLVTEKTNSLGEEYLENVVVGYYELETYDETITISGYSIPAVVTVKDLGDSVEWTIDMDENDADFTNGHAQYGLIISTDKVHPAFQVHANDGVDTNYPFGTHLYSEWVEGEGYNGWLTGTGGNNILVSDVGISAVGERDLTANPDAIFTITIPKTHLGNEGFYWAMQLMGNTVDTQYPTAWAMWSGDASTFATINLMSLGAELTSPLTIPAESSVEFVPVYDFDQWAKGTYVITTEVK